MDCQCVENMGSRYIDGELSLKERQGIEAHIKDCPSCCLLYDDLQQIVSGIRSVPVVGPRETLWLSLRARLKEEATQGASIAAGWPSQLVLLWRSHKRLASASLAALVFVLVLALSLTWRAWEKEKTAEEIAWREVRQAELHYQRAIYSLNQVVSSQKSVWDPRLVETFETNLAQIDQAIAECKEAAKTYPSNPEVARFLLAAYSRKVEFLQQMSQIKSLSRRRSAQ